MEIVNIEDKAFMGILLAAVEAFPSRYCTTAAGMVNTDLV